MLHLITLEPGNGTDLYCTGIDYFLTDKIDGKEPEEE